MVDFHRLKNLGTDFLGRAGEFAEQAKDKVAPLAEQAKDKVVPLAGKAKDAAAKGVDRAAGGIDSATGHKFHDRLGDVTGNREKNPVAASGPAGSAKPDSAAEALPAEPTTRESAPGAEHPITADAMSSTPILGHTAQEPAPSAAADRPTTSAPVDDVSADSADAGTGDGAGSDGAPSELLIVTDDGSLHHPTPADMPQHRAADDPS